MKNYKFFVLVGYIIFPFLSFCQLPPPDDPNWVLNVGLSDEFNGTQLDTAKWNAIDWTQGECCTFGGHSKFREHMVSVSNGELVLEAAGPSSGATPPYTFWECCETGGIDTRADNYQYGYYEISAKLPGNYHNGSPNGSKFWPAFWTYYVEHDTNGCRTIHDEIDILEPSGSQYADGKTNVAGWHDEHPHCDTNGYKVGEAWYTHSSALFDNYHKYAVEWLPDRVIFYFDDEPFYVEYDHPAMNMHAQRVVIDLQIDAGVADFNPSITFPQYMKVKYFRFYELEDAYCNSNLSILNNSALNSYVPGIRNYIAIGNGSSNITMNTNDSKTFRSKGVIDINGSFEVPLGSELNLIPTPCN